MSGIREFEKINQRQVENLKRKNEREVRQLADAHEKYRLDIKKVHNEEIVDIKNQNQAQVSQEAEKKEKVLTEMKNHLQQTKDLTEKELKTLKNSTIAERADLQKKFSTDRARINAEHELYLEELDHRYNESSKKISYEGNKRIEEMKNHMLNESREKGEYYQDKIHKQTENFTTRFNQNEQTNRKLKDEQDANFKKDRLTTNLRQQTDLGKLTKTHTEHVEKLDDNYRKGLKEQELFFEKKFENQLGRHNNDFKTLEDKNKKIVEDLKSSLSTEITRTASRNDDPFYKFETLKPELRQFDDYVEVKVKVPEHSKEDIQLTVNGKEALVSFNRRYSDASRMEDGTINKINKIETFTTRLQTSHVLNPKTVRSTYEDGVMTYVIKRT